MRYPGCFDPNIKNSFFVNVFFMAVHSLISVESPGSIGVESVKFAYEVHCNCTFM